VSKALKQFIEFTSEILDVFHVDSLFMGGVEMKALRVEEVGSARPETNVTVLASLRVRMLVFRITCQGTHSHLEHYSTSCHNP